MEPVKQSCAICHGDLRLKFAKYSEPVGKDFNIYVCRSCKNWQISPLPSASELRDLYENSYFSKRTNRGYDDYTSQKVRASIVSTLEKNLAGLDFYTWETTLTGKFSLEIGAAAGYFVEYLKDRNWNSMGIDISKTMTDAAQKRGLNMIHGDFLEENFTKKFDLVAMWATLEHLPDPGRYVLKISRLLKPGGRLYLTTTNTGFWANVYGKRWRFLNVPEHIFYFNQKSLAVLFEQSGLTIHRAFSYGSGFTAKKDASFAYTVFKKIADRLARYFLSGDMIVLDVRPKSQA